MAGDGMPELLGCSRRKVMREPPFVKVKDTETARRDTLHSATRQHGAKRRAEGGGNQPRRIFVPWGSALHTCGQLKSLRPFGLFNQSSFGLFHKCFFFFTCERTPPNRGRGARPCGRPCRRSRDQETQSPFISPWFSSLPLTTCTGVSDDVDFKYTRCLRDGPELNPLLTTHKVGPALFSLSGIRP